jgi:hypothetical protein
MTSRLTSARCLLTLLIAGSSAASVVAQTGAMPKPAAPAPASDAALIRSAMSAAPPAVSKDATVVVMDDKMQMRTVRKGANGWTCMPDVPNTPGPDPMCADANGMAWAMAIMTHKDPPRDKMALAYMLAGGSDASNTDPWATKPAAGQSWVRTGPHLMVMNIGVRFDGYPTTPGDAAAPYVMYPGTPYAHLMVPVK